MVVTRASFPTIILYSFIILAHNCVICIGSAPSEESNSCNSKEEENRADDSMHEEEEYRFEDNDCTPMESCEITHCSFQRTLQCVNCYLQLCNAHANVDEVGHECAATPSATKAYTGCSPTIPLSTVVNDIDPITNGRISCVPLQHLTTSKEAANDIAPYQVSLSPPSPNIRTKALGGKKKKSDVHQRGKYASVHSTDDSNVAAVLVVNKKRKRLDAPLHAVVHNVDVQEQKKRCSKRSTRPTARFSDSAQ
jgi:hypothetical protein